MPDTFDVESCRDRSLGFSNKENLAFGGDMVVVDSLFRLENRRAHPACIAFNQNKPVEQCCSSNSMTFGEIGWQLTTIDLHMGFGCTPCFSIKGRHSIGLLESKHTPTQWHHY